MTLGMILVVIGLITMTFCGFGYYFMVIHGFKFREAAAASGFATGICVIVGIISYERLF